jgi:hypothetical protein
MTGDAASENRIHRRVFISDYGKPIYRASFRVALLNALEHCLIGQIYCGRSYAIIAYHLRLRIIAYKRRYTSR